MSKYEQIEKHIKIKQAKKSKREEKLKQIDWQLKRMPELARKINHIFIKENKSVINIKTIHKNINTPLDTYI